MQTIWKENGTFERGGTERGESLWIQEEYRYDLSNVKIARPTLMENINTEVAIIGGGLAGILTAYLLQERGIPVVVLDPV